MISDPVIVCLSEMKRDTRVSAVVEQLYADTSVRQVESVDELVTLYEGGSPKFVLIDVEIDWIDTVVEETRHRWAGVPVILAYADVDAGVLDSFYAAGGSVAIPVGDSMEGLETYLESTIEKSIQERIVSGFPFTMFDESPFEMTVLSGSGEVMYSNVSDGYQIPGEDIGSLAVGDNYLSVWGVSELEEREKIVKGIADVLDGRRSQFMHDYPTYTGEGKQWVMLYATPIHHQGEVYAVVTHFDMTQPKQRLQVLNRVIRHDMANKLNIVSGYAESLRRHTDEVEQAEMAVEKINDATDSVLDLCNKIREVDATLDDAVQQEVLVSSVLGDAVRRVRGERQGIDLEVTGDRNVMVYAGSTLENALYELLLNSVTHNDNEIPRVRVAVSEPTEDCVEIQIQDDGTGLTDRQKELLNGEQRITQIEHGTGLGLWFVLWLVDRFNGEISFRESDLGGTCISMRLPKAGDKSDSSHG